MMTVRRILAALMRPFTKVEPSEATTVVIMTAASFLLLTAYYLLKTVREPLILLQGGAEVKLYARAGQTIAMVAFVQAYGELARRVGRQKILVGVFLFFISNLIVFAFLARTQLRIGLVFFLWVGVFSYTVVAQFWALAADIYTEEQGKRLFPIIGAGSSIGAVLGARFARTLMPHGPQALMGWAAGIFLVCVALIVWVERRTIDVRVHVEDRHPDEPLATEGAFHLLARDRYLLLIAGLAIALNWVNSSGEYLLDRTLLAAAPGQAHAHHATVQAFIGSFKADYYAWYNLLGVLLQLFVVSRALRYIGVRGALLIMPAFSLFGYAALALLPVLAVVKWVKIGENGLQYSLQDTTRHALFLVSSRVEKYVGKTAVDTIAVRIGAVLSSMLVWIGARHQWTTTTFALLNVVGCVAWLAFAWSIRGEHRRRSAETEALVAEEPGPALQPSE